MDREFHYEVTALVARLSGFDSVASETIAYSAQFIDDNTKQISILIGPNEYYTNEISQSSNITLEAKFLQRLYETFHFQPESKANILTVANSQFAKQCFQSALGTGNHYLIGAAAHAFCDTYAHQGFCGAKSNMNNPLGTEYGGCYGHMYFGELPDMISIKWYDPRANATIDNNKRFMKAAKSMLKYFCQYNGLSYSMHQKAAASLTSILESIWGKSRWYVPGASILEALRCKKYRRIYKELFGSTLGQYKPRHFLTSSACMIDKKWHALNRFENSKWYKFQEAIVLYRNIYEHNLQLLYEDPNESARL